MGSLCSKDRSSRVFAFLQLSSSPKLGLLCCCSMPRTLSLSLCVRACVRVCAGVRVRTGTVPGRTRFAQGEQERNFAFEFSSFMVLPLHTRARTWTHAGTGEHPFESKTWNHQTSMQCNDYFISQLMKIYIIFIYYRGEDTSALYTSHMTVAMHLHPKKTMQSSLKKCPIIERFYFTYNNHDFSGFRGVAMSNRSPVHSRLVEPSAWIKCTYICNR